MDSKRKTIGDIAQELGTSQRTIRYYEELGLIKPMRTEGGFRLYSQHDADLLRIVLGFKELGMSLEEIRAMVEPGQGVLTVDSIRRLGKALSAKKQEFENKMKKYADGIKQIDDMLGVLKGCTTCGRPESAAVCEKCLKERGKDLPAMIPPLLYHE